MSKDPYGKRVDYIKQPGKSTSTACDWRVAIGKGKSCSAVVVKRPGKRLHCQCWVRLESRWSSRRFCLEHVLQRTVAVGWEQNRDEREHS